LSIISVMTFSFRPVRADVGLHDRALHLLAKLGAFPELLGAAFGVAETL
jgi:hypothetical protein